jgi:hypothetical protein
LPRQAQRCCDNEQSRFSTGDKTMNPEQLRALADLVREFRLLLAVVFGAALLLLRTWPL